MNIREIYEKNGFKICYSSFCARVKSMGLENAIETGNLLNGEIYAYKIRLLLSDYRGKTLSIKSLHGLISCLKDKHILKSSLSNQIKRLINIGKIEKVGNGYKILP